MSTRGTNPESARKVAVEILVYQVREPLAVAERITQLQRIAVEGIDRLRELCSRFCGIFGVGAQQLKAQAMPVADPDAAVDAGDVVVIVIAAAARE